ncbi:nif11-like leader peptide domain protein [Synechococcus sp. BIOS-E4-1]|uniref:Nif11-like leader peptide family natural product precursor n=1 Tax=Synechococcus sp. BIOS-E4-1 TaxID=1400864 RepID=UPI001646FD6F|nr:Nif11-like leader peptide family natural product precursor [Synechococcus sp. BIOS-E4-1]QNI55232.1 nif11-like leader peptide domain protein [Synechococcus sp. BIOS-E4-1]
MSQEQLKAFLIKVKADSSLQEKLQAAKSTEDVVGIAKEHGHEFTADKISQLSEEELEGVAGGTLLGALLGLTIARHC